MRNDVQEIQDRLQGVLRGFIGQPTKVSVFNQMEDVIRKEFDAMLADGLIVTPYLQSEVDYDPISGIIHIDAVINHKTLKNHR